MFAIIVIVVLAAVLGIVALWLRTRSAAPAPSAGGDAPRAVESALGRAKAPTDFHVDGEVAIVTYDIEVPAGGVDAATEELLVTQAREALRDRRSRGLPVDAVTQVRVMAKRNGTYGVVAEAAVKPPEHELADAPPVATSAKPAAEIDPLTQLGSREFERGQPSSVRSGDELPAIGTDLTFTDKLKTSLGEQGVDLASATASELTLGLLKTAGYQVTPATAPGTYVASLGGRSTFVAVVDHSSGAYPELEEGEVTTFSARFAESGHAQGLLFSDKFGPFVIYDRERRDPRLKFITRERMQAFVDSIAMQ